MGVNRREFLGATLGGVAAIVDPFLPKRPDTGPLRLHPENPHYFLWRGKPTVLITAGEHYGAVLNLDFDYVRYFKELSAFGFNLTRIFSGSYREVPGSFNITGFQEQQPPIHANGPRPAVMMQRSINILRVTEMIEGFFA